MWNLIFLKKVGISRKKHFYGGVIPGDLDEFNVFLFFFGAKWNNNWQKTNCFETVLRKTVLRNMALDANKYTKTRRVSSLEGLSNGSEIIH